MRTPCRAPPRPRVSGGHAVVNVAPRDVRTKGDALTVLAARLRPRAIVYGGDDDTDEDAFVAPSVSFALRVGRSGTTGAGFFLEHQGEIDDLLRTLVAVRARVRAGPPPPLGGGPE